MAKKRPRRQAARKAAQPAELSWIAEPLRGLAVAIGEIEPDPDNARVHDAANLRAIRASLREFGQRKPLVVNRTTKRIEAGNGTYEAAKRLGWSHVAVVYVEDDATAARGFAIADNRSAELAEWDEAMLEAALEEIGQHDRTLALSLQYEFALEPSGSSDPDGGGAESQLEGLEYRIIVMCRDEAHQAELLAMLEEKGIECRALIS